MPLSVSSHSYKSVSDADSDSYSSAKSGQLSLLASLFANGQGLPRVKQEAAVALHEDDTSMATAELLSQSDDSSDDDTWSHDELLSFDSALEMSQSSIILPNAVGRFDVLSSFSFFAPELPGIFDIKSALPLFSSKLNSENLDSNPQNTHTKETSDSNTSMTISNVINSEERVEFHNSYCSATFPQLEDTTTSLSRSTSEGSDSRMETGKNELKVSTFTRIQRPYHSLPSDLTLDSSEEDLPCAVKFADQCMERSRERHSSSDFRSLSYRQSLKSSHSSVASQKSSLIASSSFTSFKLNTTALSSTVTHLSSSSSSIVSGKSSTTDTSKNSLFESSRSRRIQELKSKLRAIEIQYYRQKCMRGLNRSMVRYMKINASSNDDDSTINSNESCSDLSLSQHSYWSEAAPRANIISQFAKEIMSVNLIITIGCMLFFMYEDSISRILQGDERTQNILSKKS